MAFIFGNCYNLSFSPSSCSKPSVFVNGISFFGNVTVGTHFSGYLLRRSVGYSFDKRLKKFRVTVSNLGNGEVKVGTREISSIEKELSFTPSFSDYVKIMESVKQDRRKIDDGNSDNDNSSKRTKKQTNQKRPSFKTRDDNYEEKERPRAIKGTNGGWSQVESILLDKKSKVHDKFENERSQSNSKERYTRKGESFGKIGGTTCESGRNKDAKEMFTRQKAYDNGQQERFYQGKETKLENHGTDAMYGTSKEKYSGAVRSEHENYNRKSDSLGKTRGNFGENVRNKNAREKFVHQKAYDTDQQEMFYQEKVTKLENYGTVAMHEKSNEIYGGVVWSEHEKYQRKSDSFGKITNIGENVRNKNVNEKFARQDYQEKETTLENHGTVAMREKSNEKCIGVVRREYDAVISGKINSVIKPISQKDKKLEGYEPYPVGQKSYQKAGAKFERYESSEMQEKAQQCDVMARQEVSDEDIDDRAAFKTFEVFTDIRGRPRVLRMEMEDRIKALAGHLNAANLDIPEWKFSKLMHGAGIRFSDHTVLRVVQILGDYGNWRRALQVVQWLKSRERFNSLKPRYIYTTVLDVLGKAKRPFEALNVFHAMREELPSYPDLAAYHCIAVILGQAGLMKELFDVIDCMRTLPKKKFNLGHLQKWDPRLEPDLVVYNAVLNACVQQKQWEGAFWVLQQLKENGIRPTSTTYGLVTEVMLACGKYDLVYEFFNKVKRSYIPSALNYKVLINALWREGKTDEAVLAVKDMEQHGVVGTAGLYYDLARCLCTAGRCDEALHLIDKICKVAKKPLVVTYTGLIQTCIDSSSIENARYLFNQMQNFCAPNVITYNIMLKLYKEHKMFDEAKGLFNEIINGKVVPDKYTFNTMMEACVENGNFEELERAFLEMLHHGYPFNVRRHLKMVMDAFRAGREGVLETTWEHLISSGRVPPVPLIMERFCLKLKQGHIPSAISCITNFEENGLQKISSKTWYNLLLNNSDRLEEKNVGKLLEQINSLVESSESKNVYENVYENILRGCEQYLSENRQLYVSQH